MRVAAAILAALGGLALTGTAGATFPAAKQRLVLISEDALFTSPVVRRQDGSLAPFGLPIGVHGTAAISPDGTRAAVVTTVRAFPGMTAPALLITSLLGDIQDAGVGRVTGRAAWSPDGTKIAYAGYASGSWDIYVVGSAGGAPVDLTPSSPAADLEPRWSPDGSKIAFESDRTGNLDVFTMNADGSAVTDLTGDPAADTLGDWSPDSQRLVFTSARTGNGDLYLVSRDGGTATRLTASGGDETHAAWSPDGSTIAYSDDADGDTEVFTVAPDGSSGGRLTDNASEDIVQDWQPLKDAVAPVVHALPGKSRRGAPVIFRFTIGESGAASIELSFQYHIRNGSEVVDTGTNVDHAVAGRIYKLSLPASAVRNAPRSFRFCVDAEDASLNVSGKSCATYRLLAKPKRKTKR